MLSKFSKWLIYAASYSPAYIILAIRLLLSPQEEAESLLQKISLNYTLIAVFKIKAHIHMNETTLNSQKAKHSERRVGSH